MPTETLLSRRRLLTGRIRSEPLTVRPPWSTEETIASACTGCGACVPACPEGILAATADGRPAVDFAQGECTLCGACAEACREPVFLPRVEPAFPHVAAIGEACFARRDVHCQSCGDACPGAAIRFRPRRGGPPLPELIAEQCTGCGACIAVCPADAVTVRVRSAAEFRRG